MTEEINFTELSASRPEEKERLLQAKCRSARLNAAEIKEESGVVSAEPPLEPAPAPAGEGYLCAAVKVPRGPRSF